MDQTEVTRFTSTTLKKGQKKASPGFRLMQLPKGDTPCRYEDDDFLEVHGDWLRIPQALHARVDAAFQDGAGNPIPGQPFTFIEKLTALLELQESRPAVFLQETLDLNATRPDPTGESPYATV